MPSDTRCAQISNLLTNSTFFTSVNPDPPSPPNPPHKDPNEIVHSLAPGQSCLPPGRSGYRSAGQSPTAHPGVLWITDGKAPVVKTALFLRGFIRTKTLLKTSRNNGRELLEGGTFFF